MKALRYFFCVFCPPLAVFLTGRMGSFLLSWIFTIFGLWALLGDFIMYRMVNFDF